MTDAINALAALGITSEAAVTTLPTTGAIETVVVPAETTTVEIVVAPAVETKEVQTIQPSEVGSVEAVVGTAAPAASEEPKFEAGDTSDLSFDDLPVLKRAFAGGSGETIYKIEEIAAPGTDGKKYHGKLVPYVSGDVTAFKRSVQSSATGQNTKAKAAGAPNYYITRSHEVEGKFVGVFVIRTDDRPVDEKPEVATETPAAE